MLCQINDLVLYGDYSLNTIHYDLAYKYVTFLKFMRLKGNREKTVKS